MKYVVDFDDLCDDRDPWDALMALKAQYPELKVTLFAIPGRCSDELLAKYTALPWVQLGVHGYWHSSMECAIWTYEETLSKLAEISAWWPGALLFKAPGWCANEEVYKALYDYGWLVAGHVGHRHLNMSLTHGYDYNDENNNTVSIHGHTWDVCDNGPSRWSEMMAEVPSDATFKFVSDVCVGRSYLYKQDFGLKAGDQIIDIGAFIGEELQWAKEHGVRCDSYEPNVTYFEACKQITSPTCRVFQAAVGADNGTATLYVPGEGSYASGSSLREMPGASATAKVQVLDVLDIVRDRSIGLLKIDAEGAEWDILGRLLDEPQVFHCIAHIAVEDHSRKYETDEKWAAKRDDVKMRLAEAGVIIEVWP